jgi:hypothetical protein
MARVRIFGRRIDFGMVKTLPFKLTRTQLAYMASEEWFRSLWFIAAIVPLFGVVMLIFGVGIMKIIGLFAIAWPFSVPARGVLSTSKPAKLFTSGCFAELDEQFLTFYEVTDEPVAKRYKISVNRIRDMVERRDFYLVRTRRLEFAPIPLSAFESDADRANFVRGIAQAVERRFETSVKSL